jgi:hypothetical protein
MKSFRRLSMGYIVALAASVLLSASAQAETKHNRAVVRAIHGSGAQVSNNKGQTWAPAKVGQFLGANAAVKTSPDTTVDLFLGDNGPVVRVTPDTSLGIDKLDLENTGLEKVIETQLDLRSGRILGSVKKMAAASKYEVKTPVGVAGIRGTEYSIDARGRVTIVTGSAVVVYVIDGNILPPANVGAGQTITPPAGPQQQPQIGPSSGTGDPTLIQGITTNPDGTIVVTLQNGQVSRTTVDGITLVGGGGGGEGPGGPGGTQPGTLAPSPDPIVVPNPNHIQGENELRLSPTTTSQGASE